ncbi:MAG: TetR/AcrR family transcriptional regulator [Chloroflexi bacterium]|nr:TetR/AcrR family transcriptional regulator [Chloroflexota bacterium]
MYHIKDDQRSRRSSEMIYSGLAKLMREKDFAAITVKELVEAAQVGRTTFYRNFDEIVDVLHMRCDQVFEGLVRYIQEYRQTHTHDSGTQLLKPVLRYFYLHSELLELLMKAKRGDIAQESFRRLVAPFKPMFRMVYGVEEAYVDYILAIRIGAITSILTHWIETGKQQAPDELADKLSAMIENTVTLDQWL